MTILRKAIKITVAIVAAVSFSAGAMNADVFTKNNAGLIRPYTSVVADTTVHNRVDVMPEFPGGAAGFTDFLATNIKYPAIDRQNKVTGKVFLTFVIEPDGSLSNLKAMRSPSETLKAEAIRVLASSPKWQPGKIGGEAVRVQYTVPINFALN
jgi:TonB family protein